MARGEEDCRSPADSILVNVTKAGATFDAFAVYYLNSCYAYAIQLPPGRQKESDHPPVWQAIFGTHDAHQASLYPLDGLSVFDICFLLC